MQSKIQAAVKHYLAKGVSQDDGLALELTAKGTKYYKDDDLN